jgi:hypothetical protein
MTNDNEQLWIRMCNLLFEMEQRFVSKSEDKSLNRLYQRMMQITFDAGYQIYNPSGEDYRETRTDVEASILQDATGEQLSIKTVLKPVIYRKPDNESPYLVQKGVVIVK